MHTNSLINETSPYLLQHAHNPVNWFPWGKEALDKARSEDKPILVSIGYAACHWCHVMERESFELEEVAALMNAHFVNIKIDREERPDLDHIYMDAVQVMTGSGGWPLNVFLTPDLKPFYGGTYFPPVKAFNRPSWKEVLHGVNQAFRERRKEIEDQSIGLTDHLHRANGFGIELGSDLVPEPEWFNRSQQSLIFENIMKQADTEWGGFGKAPKFPQTFVIQFLLRHHHFTGNDRAKEQALLSLDKMIRGGIYDHLGGGFARYSTDVEWLAPHFEKMLYDNALLLIVLGEAYQLTGRDTYRTVIAETVGFLEREMTGEEGGFYAALDADSEGVEGKYYVWTKTEVEQILGEDAAVFCDYYNITESGNWEHVNILRVLIPVEEPTKENRADREKLLAVLEKGRGLLMAQRQKRVRPQTDDKYLLGWNALMCLALCRCYASTSEPKYREMAERNVRFVLDKFRGSDGNLRHAYKEGKARFPAFLDDYACLIAALIALQEISSEPAWLEEARNLCKEVLDKFGVDGEPLFYFTPAGEENLIIRKKEIYDGAVPSGNAMMAFNLYYLSIVYDIREWKQRAMAACRMVETMVTKYPSSFGVWATMMQEFTYGTHELVVVGNGHEEMTALILAAYLPNKVFQSASMANPSFPLLVDKNPDKDLLIYYCRDYYCRKPVKNKEELLQLIEKEQKT